MAYLKVTAADLTPGTARQVLVATPKGELLLAVIRDTTGQWYAVDDTCTHADVSLSEGDVGQQTIECWGHCAQFDLVTGVGELPATEPVNVYPLVIEGDDVLVEIN